MLPLFYSSSSASGYCDGLYITASLLPSEESFYACLGDHHFELKRFLSLNSLLLMSPLHWWSALSNLLWMFASFSLWNWIYSHSLLLRTIGFYLFSASESLPSSFVSLLHSSEESPFGMFSRFYRFSTEAEFLFRFGNRHCYQRI